MLAILMVPYATLLIPLYVLLRQLELDNTLLGLSLVLAVYQLPVRHLHDADVVRGRADASSRKRRWSTAPTRSTCCAGSCFRRSCRA